ncbi:uncharacterized protein LOC124355842 [Homalodisca vitripennis]|uniref:uncharacterized protein LOC124355842 n=1 Tax=Homalodisca vitripennis TaxID=197043 RepID=UPI001EEBC2CB|nr:uncharacterized protein LOC124355842 [Homalodisca vitripennis]
MSVCSNPHSILFAGDFNLPDVNWTAPDLVAVGGSSKCLIDMALAFQVSQVNTIKNGRGVILDLLFSSNHSLIVSPALDSILPQESAYPALSCEIPIVKISSKHMGSIRDFRRCNIEKIFNELYLALGPVSFHFPDVIESFNNFVNTIYGIVVRNTPLKKTARSRFPCWFSPELRDLVIGKKICHKRFKSTSSPNDYIEFSRLRDLCKELSSQCFSNYIDYVNGMIPLNIRAFWSFFDSVRGSTESADTYYLDNSSASTPEGICNLFAEHFSSVYNSSPGPIPQYHYLSEINISSCVLTEGDVERKLASLDPFKGTGPDDIPPDCTSTYCAFQ